MRLKVSPKTAIQKIDALVKEGAEMASWYCETYEQVEKEAEIEQEEIREDRERKRQVQRKQPDSVALTLPNGQKVSMPNISKLVSFPTMDMPSITHDVYDTMVVDLKRKESDLIEQLQGHSKADEAFLISSSYVLELANKADELFAKSQAQQKNELLRFVLANASVEGEKLVYKLKNPFSGIVLCNETNDWLPGSDSNRRLMR